MSQGFTRGVPIDTDPNLSLDSDLVVPSQKAVKDYIDTGLNTKQDTLTLTTTGTSGAATFASNVLNIPQYSGGTGGITALTTDVTASGTGSVVATLATPLKTGSFGVTVDGVTTLIQFGITGFVVMPYGGAVTGWSITANALGSIQFDVWKATNAIPTSSIIPSPADRPKLSNQQFFNYTSAISGWSTVTFAAGDVFGFYVDSASGLKNATLTLRCTKSPS
jgi:hypothetical protein